MRKCLFWIVCSMLGIFGALVCYAATNSVILAILGGAFFAWCIYWYFAESTPSARWWSDGD